MLEPSATTVEAIDRRLRERLSQSLDYLVSFLPDNPAASPARVFELRAKLASGPVSPWVFGAYAMIVQGLSRDDAAMAGRFFALLGSALDQPASAAPVRFLDTELAEGFWDTAATLFDTDAARPMHLRGATEAEFAATRAEIDAALSILAQAAPESHAELAVLQRLTLLARPSTDRPGTGFGGATTFFLWGASLLNASVRRDVAEMLDTLVHEASHMLLFGLVDGGALSRNDPAARYTSPLRSDPRPIDGIFHACFVSSRVHLVMERCLASGAMPPALRLALAARAEANAHSARVGLEVLQEHLQPTPAGARILGALSDYWQAARLTDA